MNKAELIEKMKRENIKVMFVANYFDVGKVKRVAEKTGAVPVVVGLAVGGQKEIKTFFDQFDVWLKALNQAFAKVQRS